MPLKTITLLALAALALPARPSFCAKAGDMSLPGPEEIAQLPADGGPGYNRLIFEHSPYLLQHARNPVDWYPWGEEALARARREDKPIFLSIGYSTCHWCHVMERESFENETIAEVLNDNYVCIKVDREERPDLDGLYMKATQMMTGRGGWPNSLWLTPEGEPWFAGTYFPPGDADGRPGFRTLLLKLADAWKTRRPDVQDQAGRIVEALGRMGKGGEPGLIDRALLDRAFENLRENFDAERGGFGGAPKFPPHGAFSLIFAEYERAGDRELLKMATATLGAMIEGGIHDQVGGGFHRYSTDARWFLPHFEKMLYDNAQLLGALAEAYRFDPEPRFRRAAEGIVSWLRREMMDPAGGFYSALDADSEGEEGKYYLWTRDELVEALGEEGPWFAELCGATGEGNYREEASGKGSGVNILYLPGGEPEDPARFEALGAKLLARRAGRVPPARDDKVLTSWNALTISGLVSAAGAFGHPEYLELAEGAADFLLRELRRDGRLRRSWRAGDAGPPAYLDDDAFLAWALLDLFEATGRSRWKEASIELADDLLARFEDVGGGFYFSAEGHDDLLLRSMDPYDHALPSGNGVAARLLLRLTRLTGDPHWRSRAEACLARFAVQMDQSPRGTESLLLAAMEDLSIADAEAESGWIRSGPLRAKLEMRGEEFLLRISLDESWHINSTEPLQDYLRPSFLSVEGGDLLSADWPEPDSLRTGFSDEAMSVFSGDFLVTGALRGDSPSLTLHFQACDDSRCLAPDQLALGP